MWGEGRKSRRDEEGENNDDVMGKDDYLCVCVCVRRKIMREE